MPGSRRALTDQPPLKKMGRIWNLTGVKVASDNVDSWKSLQRLISQWPDQQHRQFKDRSVRKFLSIDLKIAYKRMKGDLIDAPLPLLSVHFEMKKNQMRGDHIAYWCPSPLLLGHFEMSKIWMKGDQTDNPFLFPSALWNEENPNEGLSYRCSSPPFVSA